MWQSSLQGNVRISIRQKDNFLAKASRHRISSETLRRPILLSGSLLCLVVGVIPYLLWRRDALFLACLGLGESTFPSPDQSLTGYWLCYSFSDAAWYLALIMALSAFSDKSKISRLTFYSGLAMPFVFEFMQIFKAIPGTFDFIDIATYFIILIIYLILKCVDSKHLKEHCRQCLFW